MQASDGGWSESLCNNGIGKVVALWEKALYENGAKSYREISKPWNLKPWIYGAA